MPNHVPRSPAHGASCVVSTQALCYGELETSVFAVSGSAARPGGRAHVGIKFGRLLFYIEDRTALERLSRAVGQAVEMADAVFGPSEDSFALAEREGRRKFERTGDAAALR